jgi:hypothetical protein
MSRWGSSEDVRGVPLKISKRNNRRELREEEDDPDADHESPDFSNNYLYHQVEDTQCQGYSHQVRKAHRRGGRMLF